MICHLISFYSSLVEQHKSRSQGTFCTACHAVNLEGIIFNYGFSSVISN